jgi:hypothetical protein
MKSAHFVYCIFFFPNITYKLGAKNCWESYYIMEYALSSLVNAVEVWNCKEQFLELYYIMEYALSSLLNAVEVSYFRGLLHHIKTQQRKS